jgi:hypothetical protein
MHALPIIATINIVLAISLIAVLLLLIPVAVLVHCIRNPKYSRATKISWVLLILFTWPLAAYSYIFVTSRKPWTKVCAVLPIILFIAAIIWRFQKRAKELAVWSDLNSQQMPSMMGLPVPTTMPSEIPNLDEKVAAYGHLERLNQWTLILTSFEKDQPNLFKRGVPARKALGKISRSVAVAYNMTGNSQKASYYAALSARLGAE